MMHPDTEIRFIGEEIGYGVVATKFIPKGTVTWVQDELDQVLEPDEVGKMHPEIEKMVEKFAFRNNKGQLILCWDHSKYVNHSFRANCLSSAYDFELAIRDIQAGEQLTDDYGYLNITEPFPAQDEGTERNVVYPDDLLKFHEQWDADLRDAFQFFEAVDQPLKKLIPKENLKKVSQVLHQQAPMDSILNLYYEEKTEIGKNVS